MSLYPSLEDMQVDKLVRAQQSAMAQVQQSHVIPDYTTNPYPEMGASSMQTSASSSQIMYPDLFNFMGMELSHDVIAANMPEYLNKQVSVPYAMTSTLGGVVAPLTGNSVGLQRAQVTNGIRELILCKGADKKVGLRAKALDTGVFVCLVVKNSPAALAGLRFGDQILQINGKLVAGFSMDDVHKLLKKSDNNNISVIIRDRPFERNVTLLKDSKGQVGFTFDDARISNIVKDSSAARNGLLTNHQILEVNGQNVVGMKDKEIRKLIDGGDKIVTLTIIPSFIYDHMMKKLSTSWIRGKMDHSIPGDDI